MYLAENICSLARSLFGITISENLLKMNSFKLFLLRFVIYIFTFLFAVACCIYLLFKTVFNPSMKFMKIERRKKPDCLDDPVLGKHKFAQLKQIKLHYVESGDSSKPLMLFIHGFPEFWYTWRYQIKEFSMEYWTIAIDTRGYGDSEKPENQQCYETPKLVEDIKEFVNFLGREKFILVAHDWGGLVAWNFIDYYPEMVSKYIIMCCPFPQTFLPSLIKEPGQFIKSWYCFFFQAKYLPEIMMSMNDLKIFELFVNKDNPLGSQNINEKDIEAFKYSFSKPNSLKYPINYYRANCGILNWKDEHPEIFPPGLLMFAENDIFLSKNHLQYAQKYVNNLDTCLIANANHFVQQDQPSAVNFAIRNFLLKTEKYSADLKN